MEAFSDEQTHNSIDFGGRVSAIKTKNADIPEDYRYIRVSIQNCEPVLELGVTHNLLTIDAILWRWLITGSSRTHNAKTFRTSLTGGDNVTVRVSVIHLDIVIFDMGNLQVNLLAGTGKDDLVHILDTENTLQVLSCGFTLGTGTSGNKINIIA
ncbi:MAG: hypothetical protein MI784_17090, partial [Cytophagales bacterium]|nr:hypothetical protein [Cytophagales bacterium]